MFTDMKRGVSGDDIDNEENSMRSLAHLLLIMLAVSIQPALAQGWDLVVCAEASNLPFSHKTEQGFENSVAEVIANELGANLVFTWVEPPFASVRDHLIDTGQCDVIMGINDGHPHYLTTVVYYRTIYHFLYLDNSGLDIESFDDEELQSASIGILVPGRGGISPIAQSLSRRGLANNQKSFTVSAAQPNPLLQLPEAVLEGIVDVAVVPGPIAGYFQKVLNQPVLIKPVQPQIDLPFVPMYYSVSMGVRPGDESLRDDLNLAITNRWEEIQTILDEFGVERLPLPTPAVSGR